MIFIEVPEEGVVVAVPVVPRKEFRMEAVVEEGAAAVVVTAALEYGCMQTTI